MSPEEIAKLQKNLAAYAVEQLSTTAPAASTSKESDIKGARLMAKPANEYTPEDCRDLKSEISRVLAEGW